MSAQLLLNARIVLPGESIAGGSLLLEHGTIAAINPPETPSDVVRVDCMGSLVTPGLIDIHTHGIESYFYHPGQMPEIFESALGALPRYGTTCVVPTVIPSETEQLKSLATLPKSVAGGAVLAGFHIEGPFLALGGAACPTLDGNLDLLEKIVESCNGRLRIMSVSPEQKNIRPVIDRLCERRILSFMTHTRATVEETEAAIEAGARHATHFYDVFPVPLETEPGVRPVGAVEAILGDSRVSVDFICDGIHVHPAAIRAAVAAKGWQKVLLITDSNVGAGLVPGEYDTPWGYRIRVAKGDAARHSSKGFLAGSALTMNAGIRNLLSWLRLPAEQIWAMGTLNPANLLGLTSKGRIAVGADADLVLWDSDLNAIKTWVAGVCVFDREKNV